MSKNDPSNPIPDASNANTLEQRPQKPFKPLPVCSQTGGRDPEFAHLSFWEIIELEELEQFQRIGQGLITKP